MQLKSMRLIAVELTQSLKVYIDTKREYGEWEVEPSFSIGYNDAGQIIQNIEVEVIRTLGNQHAIIKAMTSFELELHTKEFVPDNDQSFLEYASMQQIAIAHARTFFIRETRGTKFAGELIPIDALEHAFRKIKLAVFNVDRMN